MFKLLELFFFFY